MHGILYLSLLPSCLSWTQYVGHIVLAAVVVSIGSLIFIQGREGKIKWQFIENPANNRRFSISVAVFLGLVATVSLLSTLFGWGC